MKHAEIARQLNEEGIPTRCQYHQANGVKMPDRQPHVKIKRWDSSIIRRIITSEVYLGTMFWNREKCGIDTGKKVVKQPKEEWIIVENHHEAVVSRELFEKANANIAGINMDRRTPGKKNLLFICGYCGRGLHRGNGKNGSYSCAGGAQQKKNECQKARVLKRKLEDVTLCQTRMMADMLAESRIMHKKEDRNDRKTVLETIIADSIKETAKWKETKMRLYEQYKDGTVTREEYISRIEKGKIRMAELEQARLDAQEELESLKAVQNTDTVTDGELEELSALECFDKDKLKTLVDKVLVYGEDEIEIVWKTENPFKGVMLS